jgi:hypothetical protein
VMRKVINKSMLAAAVLAPLAAAACGDVARDGRSPVQAVVVALEGASGAEPDRFGGTLSSDVLTMRIQPEPCTTTSPCPTIYNDLGRMTVRLVTKNPGTTAVPSAPSSLNAVTFNRYRVSYRRTDGRAVPGVDVPYGFDSAATFTVSGEDSSAVAFDIVRVAAKSEAPLRALATNGNIISTLADVTFYGRDLAGNEIAATGTVGVSFGNFADPE